jgi:hypothetical protein
LLRRRRGTWGHWPKKIKMFQTLFVKLIPGR